MRTVFFGRKWKENRFPVACFLFPMRESDRCLKNWSINQATVSMILATRDMSQVVSGTTPRLASRLAHVCSTSRLRAQDVKTDNSWKNIAVKNVSVARRDEFLFLFGSCFTPSHLLGGERGNTWRHVVCCGHFKRWVNFRCLSQETVLFRAWSPLFGLFEARTVLEI